MPAPTAPYFYSESLKRRLAQSLNDAVSDSLISIHECQWLKRLVETSNNIVETEPHPRVDRLIMEDGSPLHAELATALLISNPDKADAPVFLSTLLFGVERFGSRVELLDLLNQRYAFRENQPLKLDAERIDGSLFEEQMTTTLQHQAQPLSVLSERLHQLPSLQTALVQSLQEKLRVLLPESSVNVLGDVLQSVDLSNLPPGSPEDSRVVDVQYLATAVLNDYDAGSRAAGVERRFLGSDGQVLSSEQTALYAQAITQSLQTLPDTYERSLNDYWAQMLDDGRTMQAFAGDALAESFREKLLSAREEGTLTPFECRRLRTLLPSPSAPAGRNWVQVHRIAVTVDGQGPVKLLGVLLIRFLAGSLPDIYMYSVMEGFRRFAGPQAVTEHFGTEEGRAEMLHYSSLNDHALLSVSGQVLVQQDLIEHSLFEEHVSSIIALQKRNLDYVLQLPSVSHRLAIVQIDDALDIRGLLDSRLYSLHDSDRWRSGLVAIEQTWSLSKVPQGLFVDKKFESDALASWGEQLHEMDDFVQFTGQLRGGLASCMRHALNRYLAIVGNPVLDARRLWVHFSGRVAKPLVSLALEKIIKADSGAWPAGRILNVSPDQVQPDSVELLPMPLIRKVIALVQDDFVTRYARQLKAFYVRPVRLLDTRIYPSALSELVRERALRLELNMERRRKAIDGEALEMLQQVLNRPLRRLRESFGERCVEVYGMSLTLEGIANEVPLANTFVLCDSAQSTQYLLWSLHTGLRVFEPGPDIGGFINDWLMRLDHRHYILDLMKASDQLQVRRYCETQALPNVQVRLERIDGHFIQVLENLESDRQYQQCMAEYERALKWQLEPEQFCHVMDMTERNDSKRHTLGRLGVRLQMMQGDVLLSQWIKKASIDDQIMLLDIWQRFYASHDPKKDFLFGIPDIQEYAQEKLQKRLNEDFPTRHFQADKVILTFTQYIPAPVATGETPQSIAAAASHTRETLIEFAVDRFFAIQQGVMSVSLEGEEHRNEWLTPEYIRHLVESLDVAETYRALVEQKFDEKSEEYALRQGYYTDQTPSYELLKAFQFKLMKRLTLEGYDAIESVMTMPDGIARVPFKGRDIIISPLQLLRSEEGWAPDRVVGVYVIAPKVPQQGPWLLYSLFSDEFPVKEYADREALLADIRTSSTLQSFILSRLDSSVKHIYDSGGFQEPHLPFSVESPSDVPLTRPAPVTILVTPYEGSALQLLFRGSLETFKLLVRGESVTNAESDRASRYYLFRLLSEQILMLLPGRPGALVALWQGGSMVQLSLHSVADHHWGKAVSEFMDALSMAIASRKLEHESLAEEPEELERPEEVLEPEESPQTFRWGNDTLSSGMQERLRQLEVRNVALNELHKDNLLNTYRDPNSLKEYVAIQGKVYRVELHEGSWFIVGEERRGPRIRINERQQWELNLDSGLKGGGMPISRFQSSMVNRDVDRLIVVEARGISEIRQVYRDRAELITEGHAQARRYLETALDNLKVRPAGGIDPRAERIISEFFDEARPDAAMVTSIRTIMARLYGALMDPSLSPHDSSRYVVGINRLTAEKAAAFVFVNDPTRRIFLTEKFFRLPYYRLKVSAQRTGEFNLGPHYRGTTLLHELSHLCMNTEDIAYVESSAPFLDLLDSAPGYKSRIRNEVKAGQQETLSFQTDRSKLFSQLEGGAFRDLKRSDGGAKAAILRMTGKSTLSEARDIFYANSRVRSQVMMSNADSVALLVTLLGRVNFTGRP
ncbi:dermonecrotic toxin domain-containing protein [Pseudomonas sp. NPDC089734]|uniref:dermonecrotic toxin domain-containing protein n=1 Tax=Pseudomonas sp. NPDC089734 TaxID=3364469 RepID=UPI0038109FFA